ncbi:zinc finger protein 345-like [Leguminivora glycinivorella]|uniref:zinc finger protein 345-like n=1 Tax=Leguminivora glycinivorella TaxID=1035111 RepID=UPI00200F7844|nr:zinc finger protein 345-like [Leguminivora glycinivorella]
MKEININIEGYNVNGICVGCLNYNRKMFYCNQIKECFKLLGDIDVPDGLQVQVCWECLAAVQASLRFRNQIIDSYNVLIDYSRKHTFLNSPSDLSVHARQRLTATPPEMSSLQNLVQIEVDVSIVKEETKEEIVVETEPVKSETEYFDNIDNTDFQDAEPESSEDDMQLSKLKRKKDRKTKKVKRKREERQRTEKVKIKTDEIKTEKEHQRSLRKLKNLPTDLVELYTMTEEEMWEVRAEDVSSAEFCALKYKCSDCVIGFNSERLMQDHMQGKHLPKSPSCHQCDVCRAYFLTRDNVASHRALHFTAYRCTACDARTALKRRMVAHARTHREQAVTCHTCGEQFSTKSKLSYHRGVCNQARPQCDCCGKVFANKMTLKYHLKILPQNKEDKPKEKLYITCKGCDKVFHSKKSYRAHAVIHDGLTYPCPICGKLFQWKRNLARHTRNHRDRDAGATHECRDCGKTFSSRDCYNNHMKLSKRHVQEDAYVHECSYCGKKFATKWCMVDHIDWDHLKRIKYQCSVCFKAFKTAKIMVAHMNNIHEGKKNREPEGEHLCEICGKSYKTVKRLKGHVWAMHTNRSTTKSFKCKLCPATFTWQTSIYKHVKMMHDKRPKQFRPPVKKQEFPGAGADLIAREYFQQPAALAHIPLHNIVHNIV